VILKLEMKNRSMGSDTATGAVSSLGVGESVVVVSGIVVWGSSSPNGMSDGATFWYEPSLGTAQEEARSSAQEAVISLECFIAMPFR